jgi:hypothetical protein
VSYEIEDDQEESGGDLSYSCAYCGETNEILVEESIERKYEVVEDCSVCCKPNVVHLERENGRWTCWATPENE